MTKPAKSKTRRNPDRTRATILAAAQAEFARNGLSGARVDVVAARARSNKRMIYHYFGNKEGLYLAVLEQLYAELRGAESALNLLHLDPPTAIRRLVEFSFDYSRRHPELISLINDENLHRARHLRKSRLILAMHSPLIATLDEVLTRGATLGLFRSALDPVDVYIAIAARSYFFLSNNWTLSVVFKRDLASAAAFRRARRLAADDVLAAIEAKAAPTTR